MKSIDVDYSIVRDGEVIFEGYAPVKLTDKNIKEVAEFIKDNHYSGELVDVPSHVYDRIFAGVSDVAIKDMKTERKDVLYESDEVKLQEVLPADLVNLLPEELLDLIDMDKILEYYPQEEEDNEDENEKEVLELDDSQIIPLRELEHIGNEEDSDYPTEDDNFQEIVYEYKTDEQLAQEEPDWVISDEEREEPSKENTLYLTIKQADYNKIISGNKRVESREIKDTTYKKYLELFEDGNLVIDDDVVHDIDNIQKYDIYAWNLGEYPYIPKDIQYLNLAVGYNKDRDTALVQVDGYSFRPQFLKTNVIGRLSNDAEGNLQIDPNGDQCFWLIVYHIGKVIGYHKK